RLRSAVSPALRILLRAKFTVKRGEILKSLKRCVESSKAGPSMAVLPPAQGSGLSPTTIENGHQGPGAANRHVTDTKIPVMTDACACNWLITSAENLPPNPLRQYIDPDLFDSFPPRATMISDDELYRLAVFLGSTAMVLIVVYNFFEVNAQSKGKTSVKVGPQSTSASAKSK
ncbi:hypothetical protein V8F33_003600, partial [Rhypophila sp. PSN 637]